MKHLKMLGLLAVAAAALMAFAGTASATTLTSPEGTNYTGEFSSHAFNTEMHGSFVTVKCGHSYLDGDISSHGGISAASVNVTDLIFKECNYWVTVEADGFLEIDSENTVRSSGTRISISTSVGTCVFTTSFTTIGSLTEGSWPTLDINSAKIPRTGGNFLCGSSGTWTGSYDLYFLPNGLWVD